MIEVNNLSKVFRIPHAKKRTLYHNMLSVATSTYDYEEFYALNDVSFRVSQGEFVGVIGRNGSGKSTLLKILAGIYKPTSGNAKINDEVFPLLELGVGFQADFTVRDNIYLYGALLGFSRFEMRKKLDEIIAFAELDRFVDARLEKLSTGMQMRLGFAIAIQSVAPIMLVDEVLAVGDQAFGKKCRATFQDLKQKGTTLIYVSHMLSDVQDFCERTIVLSQGRIVNQGDSAAMVQYYNTLSSEAA